MNANMHGATGRTTGDAGFALPLVVFALVLLGVMGIAGLQSSRDELLSAMAVSNSHRAFYAAEAGIHKAVSNWSQLDTLMDYPGDTLVESWTEVENGCSYQLAYRRIDDGDGLYQFFSIESTGRSPGLNGATRRVGTIMKSYVVVGAGVAYDGTLSISGNPEIRGPCSDVHTNFDINVEGDPKIGGNLSTSGIATGPGSPTDTLGNPITAAENQPTVNIPQLYSTDFCAEAEYILGSNGQGLKVSTSETYDFTGGGNKWGWKYVPGPPSGYESVGVNVDNGVYCVDGDLSVGTNIGAPGNPAEVTFLTTGSVQINGNPYIVSAHPDSILIMADGDLKLNGNPVAGATSMEGLLYGGAQCAVSGNPVIYGQLLCKDNPNPPGSTNWIDENQLNGNMILYYSCGGLLGGKPPEPLTERYWNHVW